MEMGDMGSPKLKFWRFCSGRVFNLSYWYPLDREARRSRCVWKSPETKNRELADVKAKFLERQTQANNYKRRWM